MATRLLALVLVLSFAPAPGIGQGKGIEHLSFSLVHGSTGFVSTHPAGVMTDAPHVVLAFSANDGHKNLVMTEDNGDYTAVLEAGHYCLSAYELRTGSLLSLDPRQLKCIDVINGRDVRLDIMLKAHAQGN